MPRLARVKSEIGGWYHLCCRASGPKDEYPLNNTACRRRLVEIFELFSRVFCCDIAAFTVMGSHYHLLVRMDLPQEMSRKELWGRAALLYPERQLEGWLSEKWERFEERIFDVSELMRSVNAAFARWYNQHNRRRGSFWAKRFKSVLLEDAKAARDYCRGTEPTKVGQAKIPKWLVKEEESRGFETRGAYRKRLRCFADGVVLGSRGVVKHYLDDLVDKGVYKRRKNPIEYDTMDWFALRPHRGME